MHEIKAGSTGLRQNELTGRNMNDSSQGECRYFLTYSGVKLPLKLCQPLEDEAIANRNTYFQAWFDGQERIITLKKMVYGEVEMEHRYCYHDNGRLATAEIVDADGDVKVVNFDDSGLAQH